MPLVGFGTWQIRGREAESAVRTALDAGYRLIDTATVYRNEAQVGRAVASSGIDRRDLFITTKLPPELAGRERQTISASLDALELDYIDLWLVHWPPAARHIEPTWERLLEIRDEGLAVSVGVSNYSMDEIDRLIAATAEAPTVNQVPWAPSLFDPEFLAASRERGIVVEGYSPFNNTDLSDPRLVAIASHHGVTAAQVVLRWHVQHEVVAIPKSATPERIVANFDVFGFELTEEEMRIVDAMRT
jgi:diketogulonate reductase-like aldo/keto reductase